MVSSNSTADAVRSRWPAAIAGPVLLLAFMLVLSWWLGSLQRESLLDELERKSRQELDLYISHLSGQLGRYAFLPALLADDHRLQALLVLPDDQGLRDTVNRFLGHVNAISGALDVYLMDATGETLAASNWRDERTFVGRNFDFRPYFIEAMEGRPGRYYALGTTSGRRGYYFSYPVGGNRNPAGVIVVKVAIDTLEYNWRGQASELVVSDPDGVIFISTRPQWLFHTLHPLGAEVITRIRESRRYPEGELTPVFAAESVVRSSGGRMLRVNGSGGETFLAVETEMPVAGWQVQLLVSPQVIAPQVWQTRLFVMSLLLLLATVTWLIAARSRRRRERESEKNQVMQEALVELERRVSRRTADLTEANRLLRQEVEEHERTRDELIQAAKLAALGQMSAGINHELNQPLAAMRTYADNARTYLERENLEQAAWNLQQISELTGRMAQISSQLKVFSRKATGQRIRVSLRACLDGAQRIVRSRMQNAGVALSINLPAGDLSVIADMVQLEQVLVNLIGNACDVLHDHPVKRIEISAGQDGDVVRLRVRDSGPGIDAENLARIFDPFFTTSESGLGLGLSISYTIVQRLGGSLTAGNAHDGGAVFTLTLPAWDEMRAAAGGA